MITAKEARKNTEETIENNIDKQLKNIYSKIKGQSLRNSVKSILVSDISEKNRKELEQNGFKLRQETYGASRFSWNVCW